METEFTIQHASASLRASSRGRGANIVMLHAGVADRRMWRHTLLSLSSDHHALAYDRRGFGETEEVDEPFRHVDDLDAVIEHIGGPASILIGCSQGGRVAIDFALAHPHKVAALVLVATAVTGAPAPESYSGEIAVLMAQLDEAEATGDIERVNAIEARLWLDGPLAKEGRIAGEVRQLFLEMNGTALRRGPLTHERPCPPAIERLQSLAVPSLVVWGDLDFPHIQRRSQHIADTIPGARPHIIAGCAHLPSLEQPREFNRAVEAFLATVKT